MDNSQEEYFIKVCVRLRPLARAEMLSEFEAPSRPSTTGRRESMIPQVPRKTATVLDKNIIIFDPSDMNKEFVKGVPTHDNKRIRDIQYAFDRVFDEHSSQQEVRFCKMEG